MKLSAVDRRAIDALKPFVKGGNGRTLLERLPYRANIRDIEIEDLWRMVWYYRNYHCDVELIEVARAANGLRHLIDWMRGWKAPLVGALLAERQEEIAALRRLERWTGK